MKIIGIPSKTKNSIGPPTQTEAPETEYYLIIFHVMLSSMKSITFEYIYFFTWVFLLGLWFFPSASWLYPEKKICRLSNQRYILIYIEMFLFEYHRLVVPFPWAVTLVRSLSTYSRLLAGIPIMAVFQNLSWNSNTCMLDGNCQLFRILKFIVLNNFLFEGPIRTT